MLICDNRYYEKVGSEVKDITDEIDFDLPSGWEYIRLLSYVEKITDYVASGSFASLRENVKYYKEKNYAILVKTQDFQNNFSEGLTYTDEHGYNFLSNSNLFGGELLLSNIGSIGKVFIVPYLQVKMTLAPNAIMVKADSKCRNWLRWFFESSIGFCALNKISSGTTMKKFNKTDLARLLIPVPPLSEQRRIIAQIEELFAQIDIIEQNQADIDELYDEFRRRTLTLAIQGKLVPQDSNDEPASVLLERIRAEKKAKLGKKYVDSYIYKGDDNCYYEHIAGREQDELVDVPFDIPDNWVWRRIDGVAFLQSGKPFEELEAGTPYVKVSDMNLPENNTEITTSQHYCKATRRDIISQNSIIFPKRGGAISTNKKRKVLSFNCCIDLNTMCMTPFLPQMLEYLFAWFLTIDLGMIHDGTSVPQINNVDIYPLFVPIPPLAEQKRIVAKINDIFAML